MGAPMYTDIHLAAVERGRVYVFNNTRVSDGHWTGYNHVIHIFTQLLPLLIALPPSPSPPFQGNLSSDSVILEGQVMRGRFGTSVTNLGDIDDDGYEGVCMRCDCDCVCKVMTMYACI